MDIKSPSSEPSKSYEKSNTEKINTEKAEKQEVKQKPNDKPKPKNKIERPKINIKKEPENKIERPKVDIHKEPRNKIQREKINLQTPARNKIERPKIDLHKEPRKKIQREKIDLDSPVRNKIERIPTNDLKNTIKAEGNQLSLEKTKEEMKQIDWKSVSENWTVKVSANKEITLNPYKLPSKENPLYKHKQWLQTVYNHKKWNLNDDGLRTISGVSYSTVYKWRKKFNIPTSQPSQKPFNDGKQKECGRCHQIKLHNEFGLRNDKRKDKPYLRSNCNQCKSELNQIYIFKNKLKILGEICGGKDKIKCSECETKADKLPTFDFHHPDNKFKELKRIRINKNWNKTKEILEKEKVIPLCKNCHAVKKTAVYNRFKEMILKKNNFEKKLEGIENNIHQYVKTNFNTDNPKSQLIQIKSWIKKRIVIEKLFNGNCIGCGEDKLPSLQFHHIDPEKKTYRSWSDINHLNISQIIKKFKEDTAICLCANCHSMAESRHFEENIGEILNNRDLRKSRTFYEKLNRNIKNYSFPIQLERKKNYIIQTNQKSLTRSEIKLFNGKEIEPRTNHNKSHLTGSIKYQTVYGDGWKKYLFHINKLIDEGKIVQTKILAEHVGVNTRNTRKNIQKLIANGMISINGEHNNRTIILTEKGRNESKDNFPYIYM